jgi:general secretion pathway protein G
MQVVNRTKTRGPAGFSLIELVIVIVIIGIIGAIAIPRMSRGAAGAADSALKGNLAVLRNAIELYAAEHGGQFPPMNQMPLALTGYSNAAGTDFAATKSSTRIYGPYLRAVPPLPVGPQKGSVTFTDTADANPTEASAAWVYNATTGAIRANTGTLTDDSGREYSTY